MTLDGPDPPAFAWLSRTGLLLVVSVAGCGRDNSGFEATQPEAQPSTTVRGGAEIETARMADMLERIAAEADPAACWNLNGRHAEFLGERLRASPSPPPKLQLAYARELLNSGRNTESIEYLTNTLVDPDRPWREQVNSENLATFLLLGLAHLRQGERENCRKNHNPYSCILPLNKVAEHQHTSGSQNALEIFESIFRIRPDPTTRWLINLAHMTLGQYPDQVDPEHRIEFPAWSREQKDFPRFNEVATQVGVAELGLAGGVSLEDFNGDDRLDIFVTSYGLKDQVKLFLNDGQGGFTDATEQAGLLGIVSGLNCIHADYDNDGDCDIFVLRGAWFGDAGSHPNSLLRNDGKGHFDDVTESAGLLSFHPTQAAV